MTFRWPGAAPEAQPPPLTLPFPPDPEPLDVPPLEFPLDPPEAGGRAGVTRCTGAGRPTGAVGAERSGAGETVGARAWLGMDPLLTVPAFRGRAAAVAGRARTLERTAARRERLAFAGGAGETWCAAGSVAGGAGTGASPISVGVGCAGCVTSLAGPTGCLRASAVNDLTATAVANETADVASTTMAMRGEWPSPRGRSKCDRRPFIVSTYRYPRPAIRR